MGLTSKSTGAGAADKGLIITRKSPDDKVVALAGNPNVGKSTVFNGLTGMNQHTGNWPGKTVTNAQGICASGKRNYIMVDIPGTYSLMAHSAEEEVARNFICFGEPDAVVVVCDATCLERNLNLVLQTTEITNNVIVCVNLLDEAKRKNIRVDLTKLEKALGVPVIGVTARKKKSLLRLVEILDNFPYENSSITKTKVTYPDIIEKAITNIQAVLEEKDCKGINPRWLALKILDPDESLIKEIVKFLGDNFLSDIEVEKAIKHNRDMLADNDVTSDLLKDMIVSSIVSKASEIGSMAVVKSSCGYNQTDRIADKIFTSRLTGYPVMLILLAFVFWLTITGANYPSALISNMLFRFQEILTDFFAYMGAPDWLHGIIVLGVYRVLAWVVSVMLPPMAIFFPLFTLLEDAGYLPRVAYNLDKSFRKCNACGKQALTMCMGFGCNAAGIVGCRIIDSPRERLLAILTNNFVPCNGRFPTLIAILSMFFVLSEGSFGSTMFSALLLTLVILFGVFTTFTVTKLLSKTVLKGIPSSFTLELPPYRKPQIGKVIVRSIFDRTLFVLGRAAAVAAPCGAVIWLMANINIGSASLLYHCSSFLDPFARLMGLDGVILMAFILGFPANEIVFPIIIMSYLAKGTIIEMNNLAEMKDLLISNGWTAVTALNTMLFSLLHWPCSTTLITIKKETQSAKWTLTAFLLPTIIGIIICMSINFISMLF